MLGGFSGLLHGEAISIGMGMAVDLVCTQEPDNTSLADLRQRQDALFTALGLPNQVSGQQPDDILAAMRTDKKYKKGKARLILPTRIGHVELVRDTPEAQILAAIAGRCG